MLETREESDAMVPVGEFDSLAGANEHALVVLSMNLACWIHLDPETRRFRLFVEPPYAVAVTEELEEYRREQAEFRIRLDPPVFRSGIELALLWCAVLLTIYLFQQRDPLIAERFCNSSEALLGAGEWWRPFTALFLHGDGPHLLGNLAIGGVFCVLVAHSFGPWRGWWLILVSGTLGNALTAWWHAPEPFRSLGASTATFGALGLLVGLGLRNAWRSRSYREMRPLMVPLAVGFVMLGWFGAGGGDPNGNTDVLGHALGCLAGVVLGVVAAPRLLREKTAGRPHAPA